MTIPSPALTLDASGSAVTGPGEAGSVDGPNARTKVVMDAHPQSNAASPSRPVSPSPSPAASTTRSPALAHPSATSASSSPSASKTRLYTSNSSSYSVPALGSTGAPAAALSDSAVFERDAEFADDHLFSGSEALELAAAPVLSEVAQAVSEHTAIIPTTSLDQLSQSLAPESESHFSLPMTPDRSRPSHHSLPTSRSTSPLRVLRSADSGHRSEHTPGIPPIPSLSLSPSVTGSPLPSTPGSPAALHGFTASAPMSEFDTASADDIAVTHPILSPPSKDASPSPLARVNGNDLRNGSEGEARTLSLVSLADIINSERMSASSSPADPHGLAGSDGISSDLSSPVPVSPPSVQSLDLLASQAAAGTAPGLDLSGHTSPLSMYSSVSGFGLPAEETRSGSASRDGSPSRPPVLLPQHATHPQHSPTRALSANTPPLALKPVPASDGLFEKDEDSDAEALIPGAWTSISSASPQSGTSKPKHTR